MTTRAQRAANLVMAAIFLVVISVPGLGLLAGFERATVSVSEARELAKLPQWSWQPAAIPSWIEGFQNYFADHFALRGALIRWRAHLLWFGLRTTPSDTVIAGRDGWMFYAGDGGLEDWVETRPFTAKDLEGWRAMLERTRDWLAAYDIPYLFVIAPDKQMIYPEKMPASLRRMRGEHRADQLLVHLRAHSTIEVLDLRPAMIAAKPSELLYHLYDSHWNDRGALVGYREIARKLRRWFPALVPLERSDFHESHAVPSGDRTSMLAFDDPGKRAMPGLVLKRGRSWQTVEPAVEDPYGEDGRVVTEIPGSRLPRAVMFRDSFASRLIPYLSENFSRAVYVWYKYFDPEVVLREKPDVVIQEVAGRHLVTDPPTPSIGS